MDEKINRSEVKALFDKFIAELQAPAILPILVREGDEPGSIIIENFQNVLNDVMSFRSAR